MPALAKITRPTLYKVLPRERLFERLEEGLAKGMAWVSGPPGAGKTALVASFLAERRIGGIWLHIDAGDNDLASFFYYLSQTVPLNKGKAGPLPVLSAELAQSIEAFARLFFRQLFARMKQPAAFVLDNFHELSPDAPLHKVLAIARQELPAGIALIVISRHAPDAAWLNRAMSWVDWAELKLTEQETRAIANLRGAVDENLLANLQMQTGGWAAGLTLALEQSRRPGIALQHHQHDTQDLLFQFFASQIFAAAEPVVQQSLMRIALFPRFTVAMASALCDGNDTQRIVDEFYHRRLFVERRGEYYQFHDLFRAFLLTQLKLQPAQELTSLYQRAAQQLVAVDEVEAACQLLATSGGWALLTQLILANGQRWLEAGRFLQLRTVMMQLPEKERAADTRLTLWLGLCELPFQPVQARQLLQSAIEDFEHHENLVELAVALTGIITSFQFDFSDLRPLEIWLEKLDRVLTVVGSRLPPTVELRARSTLLYAMSFRQPDVIRIEEGIQRVLALLAEPLPVNHRVAASCHVLLHAWHSADRELGRRAIALAEELIELPEINAFNVSMWWKERGNFELMCGSPREAVIAYARATETWDKQGIALPSLYFVTTAARCVAALLEHDLDSAEQLRSSTEKLWHDARVMDRSVDSWLRALIAARQKKSAIALAEAKSAYELGLKSGVLLHQFHCALQMAIAQIDFGDANDAESWLAIASKMIERTAFQHFSYVADWVRAYAARRVGDGARCVTHLARALQESHHDDGKLFLRLQPDMATEMCAYALRQHCEVVAAKQIIRECRLRPRDRWISEWPWPLSIKTLGNFQLLCDGEPLTFGRKAPKRTLALLKVIVALGGERVSEQQIVDALWPDEEGDAGFRSLTAALHRLRALLNNEALIIQQGGSLSLDRDWVSCDVWQFEYLLHESRQNGGGAQALDIYHGAFLPEDLHETWAFPMRERLRGKFVHELAEQAQKKEVEGDYETAIRFYLRGLDADNAIEPFYQGLMRCYGRLNRVAEALTTYQRAKRILSISLGISPSAETEKLFQALKT